MVSKMIWGMLMLFLTAFLIVLFLKTTYQETIMDSFERGDFGSLKDNLITQKDVSDIYQIMNMNNEAKFVRCDINGDDIDELILREERSFRNGVQRIIGIFVYQDYKMCCVYWDINDSTEYCFLGENGNVVYYTQHYGTYLYEEYSSVEFDSNWAQHVLIRLEIWNVYDLGEVRDDWTELHPDMSVEGIHCKKIILSQSKEEEVLVQPLSVEQFLTEFYKLTGFDFASMDINMGKPLPAQD